MYSNVFDLLIFRGHNICVRYPDYKVAFYGIGPGPSGSENLGCCSQMALFVREDFLKLTSNDCDESQFETPYCNDQPNFTECKLNDRATSEKYITKSDQSIDDGISVNDVVEDMIVELSTTHIENMDYRLIKSCVYPRNADERSHEQKIFDEACFHLARYQKLDDDHYDGYDDVIKVPVQDIFNFLYKLTSDINEFK